MLKNMHISDWIIVILIPLQVFAHRANSPLSINYIYFLYMLIIFFYVIENKSINIYNNEKLLYLSFFVCFFGIPLMLFHIRDYSGFIYVFLQFIFILVSNIVGRSLLINKNLIFKLWAVLSAILVDFEIITNITEININTMTSVFKEGNDLERYRATFGFTHPNFAALVIVTVLFICYMAFKSSKNMTTKSFFVMQIIVLVIPLICTGSRTACFCSLAFIVFLIGIKHFCRIKNIAIKLLMILGLVLLIGIYISDVNFDFEEVSSFSSGRLETVVNGLDILHENGGFLFGYAVSNVSQANATISETGAMSSDNWYYLHIIRFGMIGLIVFMIPIINWVVSIYRYTTSHIEYAYFLPLLFTLLLYGVGENVVFNQGVVMSTVVWSMIFYALTLERY